MPSQRFEVPHFAAKRQSHTAAKRPGHTAVKRPVSIRRVPVVELFPSAFVCWPAGVGDLGSKNVRSCGRPVKKF
jgi:hypothetical protein